jgi:hypothetical protein
LRLKSDQVQGSICAELCKKSNLFAFYKNYELIDCYNLRPVKGSSGNEIFEMYDQYKAVFTYQLKRQEPLLQSNVSPKVPERIVLKSRNRYFFDFDSHLDFDFNQKKIEDQLEYLIGFFEGTLNVKFGIELDPAAREWLKIYKQDANKVLSTANKNFKNKDLIYYLKLFAVDNLDVFLDSLRNKNSVKMGNYIANLLILMSQDEYLFYRFFQAKPGVLKVIGSCGN